MKKCIKCGEIKGGNAEFCSNCGNRLTDLEIPNNGREVKKWFCFIDNQQIGPFSIQMLEDLFQQNKIIKDTYIWDSGNPSEWKMLKEFSFFQNWIENSLPPLPPNYQTDSFTTNSFGRSNYSYYENCEEDWYYRNYFKKIKVSSIEIPSLIEQGEISYNTAMKKVNGKWRFLEKTEFKELAKVKKPKNICFTISIITLCIIIGVNIISFLNISNLNANILGGLNIILYATIIIDFNICKKANLPMHRIVALVIFLFAPFLYAPYRFYVVGKKKVSLLLAIIAVIFTLLSYANQIGLQQNGSIQMVKNGHMNDYPYITISEIFDDNLDDVKWSEVNLYNKTSVKMVGKGRNLFNNTTVEIEIWFNIKGNNFEIGSFYINGVKATSYDFINFIDNLIEGR